MPQLKFYDLRKRKTFMTDKFRVEKKGKRHFAIATAPSGVKSWRIISKDDYNKFK